MQRRNETQVFSRLGGVSIGGTKSRLFSSAGRGKLIAIENLLLSTSSLPIA
jgi:hypothetical protein